MTETVTTRVVPLKQLSGAEKKRLRNLTMRERGCMFYDLTDVSRLDKSCAIMIEDVAGKLLAWSLLYPMFDPYGTNKGMAIELYTRVSERRKGYGSLMYSKAKKEFPRKKLFTFEHDSRSIQFFKHVKSRKAKTNVSH